MRLALVAVTATLFLGNATAQTVNDVAAQCNSMYLNQFKKIYSDQREAVAIEMLHQTACSKENFGIDGSFDQNSKSIVEGIPVVSSLLAKLNIQSNKQFCSAYDKKQLGYQSYDVRSAEPVVEAMDRANQCIEIASRSASKVVLTSVSSDPSQVAINGEFKGSTGSDFRFSGLTTGGFVCKVPTDKGRGVDTLGVAALSRRRTFNILCERPALTSGNRDYADGTVTVTSSEGGAAFVTKVAGDEILSPATRRSVVRRLETLQRARNSNRAAAAQSYNQLQDRVARARPLRWYYWMNEQMGEQQWGKRYACDSWHYGDPLGNAQRDQCPSGTVVGLQHIKGEHGGDCGFNAFAAVCVPNS